MKKHIKKIRQMKNRTFKQYIKDNMKIPFGFMIISIPLIAFIIYIRGESVVPLLAFSLLAIVWFIISYVDWKLES